jgi:hypothetical protein
VTVVAKSSQGYGREVASSKENVTFRLNKETLEKLRLQADDSEISVNNLAQKILSEYFDWYANSGKAGLVPIHKSLVALTFGKMSEQEIIKIAKIFAGIRVKEITLVLRNDYSMHAFLETLEAWMNASSIGFVKNIKNGARSYAITHDLGENWSLFFSQVLQSVFGQMGIQDVKLHMTDSTIVFSIPIAVAQASSKS